MARAISPPRSGASRPMPAARGAARSARPAPGPMPGRRASQVAAGDQQFLLGINQRGTQQIGQKITHLGVEIGMFPGPAWLRDDRPESGETLAPEARASSPARWPRPRSRGRLTGRDRPSLAEPGRAATRSVCAGLATVRGSRGRAALPAGTMERMGKKQDQPGIAARHEPFRNCPAAQARLAGPRVDRRRRSVRARGKLRRSARFAAAGRRTRTAPLAVQWLEPPGPGKTDVLGERSAKQNVDR